MKRLFAICFAVAQCVADGIAAGTADYGRDIKPLLRARCYACHGALKQEAGLRVDTAAAMRQGGKSGPAITPRDPGRSLLLAKVTAPDSSERMPQEGAPLTPEQVALLRAWIEDGARASKDEQPEPDPHAHWAFQPVKRPPLPSSRTTHHAPRNPIDLFLNARLAREKLTPLPPAPRHQQLRRVYLDLIGLPPTREELHAFLADTSPDAYERVVDRLLDDPRHGERWGRHWMDVWRYSDWFGRRMVPDVWNSAPQIWRWRDWIVRSLNADKGYDRMIVEMLAADEIAPLDDEAAVATGFLIRNWYALNPNEWMRANVEHTGKAFLGLTFNCAHCHDHKYDPITQQDYFAFRAFFEPLYVRQDRWPGEPDPGPFQDYDYSVKRNVQRLGMVRVFDKDLDAKTWFYTGGDERNRLTNRPPVAPGMPVFLGGDAARVTPVSLPAAAFYPGLRDTIQRTERNERRAALAKAESALAALEQANAGPTDAQRAAFAAAEQAFHNAVAELTATGESAALSGRQSLVFDATKGRRVLVHSLAGLPELGEGATVRYRLRLLTDTYAGFQLAKDTARGLTAAYVGFVGGKIHAYKPGTTEEFEAGAYAFTNGQHRFEVTLALEPDADRALLTVRSLGDERTLVNRVPVALNGWNPAKHPQQGILLDARTGSVCVWDELVITAGAGRAFHFDFEPPCFADGQDAAGVEGWQASSFSAAPATSMVSSIACSPELREKQQAMLAAQRVLEAPELRWQAAQAAVAAAKAELAASEARIAADEAKFGGTEEAAKQRLATAAGTAEREAAVQRARADIAAADAALAGAEGLPSDDKGRDKAMQAASKRLGDARAALTKAEQAQAKGGDDYTPFSPVYPQESTGRRKALAEWIASRDNPLTARVAVNHLWLRHFHRPLVESVYDFGRSGQPPTHPELLDWLAAEFMDSGWSMKHVHRLIATSAAYRRSSSVADDVRRLTSDSRSDIRHPNPDQSLLTSAATADPENRLLWRMNTGRMEAEVVRDSILHLAGVLESRMGGQELENKDALTTHRRSLYYSCNPELDGRSEFGALFDAPDPNECYRRTRSIVPQQALALTNSRLVHDHAPALARRLGIAGADAAAFITAAFEEILGRRPGADELAACAALFDGAPAAEASPSQARESLVRVLLNHNDFQTIR
jgi:hypothetical protein